MLTNATGDGGHGGMLSLIMAWNKTSLQANLGFVCTVMGKSSKQNSPSGGENMVIYHGIIRTKKKHILNKQKKSQPKTHDFFAPQQQPLDDFFAG